MAKISRQKVASAAVGQLTSGKDSKHVARELAAFLITHKMEKHLDQLLNDIAVQLQKVTGHMDVSVTTAFPLADNSRTQLIRFIREEFHAKSVGLDERQDSAILGGFTLQTPEYTYDASVRYQLNQLANAQGDI